MALKNCPECDNKVSSTAFECPQCGCVLKDKLYVQIFKAVVKVFKACLMLLILYFVALIAWALWALYISHHQP